MGGQDFTASFIRGLEIGAAESAPIACVLEQRAAYAELYALSLLAPSLDGLLSECCRLAAEGCAVPYAKVLEHRPKQGRFLLCAGWGWKSGVIGESWIADDRANPAGECIQTLRAVVTSDLAASYGGALPAVYRDHAIVAAANVPIVEPGGATYGVLAIDSSEPRHFTALEVSYLATIAGIVGHAVERTRQDATLLAAHEARALLLREHHHRVRNSYHTLLAQLQQHARHASTENARQRFQEVERRVFALASLYNHLLGGEVAGRLDLGRHLAVLCEDVREFYALDVRGIVLSYPEAIWAEVDLETGTAVGIVVNELIANAVEHAFCTKPGGTITLTLGHDARGGICIRVHDDGDGLGEACASSTGLEVAKRLLGQIGGSLAQCHASRGTCWEITLPHRKDARNVTARAAGAA